MRRRKADVTRYSDGWWLGPQLTEPRLVLNQPARDRVLTALMWSKAGMSGIEIAKQMGVSSGRAYQMIARAKQHMEAARRNARIHRRLYLDDLRKACIATPQAATKAPPITPKWTGQKLLMLRCFNADQT